MTLNSEMQKSLYEQLTNLARDVEDGGLAEQMIHIAAKVRTLELSQERIKREAAADALEDGYGYTGATWLRDRAAELRAEGTQ